MEKKPYVKPTIVRHASGGILNKFGRPPQTVPTKRIEGYAVEELAAEYGSPLFILSVRELRQKYRDMNRAFRSRYPNFQISYSYKTNYLKSVCAILHQEGAWAEVVSGFEYDIAENLGVPGNQIIFNGPYKTRDELKKAFAAKSMVNIDNYDEMQVIEDIADELGEVLEVGVRINMDLNDPPWHKFGFNVESGQAYEAVKRMVAGGKLKVVGLHIHTGTYVDDVSVYSRAAEGMVRFYSQVHERWGVNLKYWDLGGGYASQNTLHWAYLPGEQTCPTFDQYAQAICPILMEGNFANGKLPRLFIEPGRALVDEPFSMITRIVAQKRLPTGARAVVLDTGMNMLSSVQWYRYQMQSGQDSGTTVEDTIIYGGLCMNIDVVNPSISLPPVRREEFLVIPHVGAYNLSQSWQFIYLRPAVIAIEEGKVHVIKRAETREYVQEFEELPEDFNF
ncbi:diaminopimelate decarboxylase [bacterium]|nr:diaminopimelate decarboxylase [bacterium]